MLCYLRKKFNYETNILFLPDLRPEILKMALGFPLSDKS